VSAGPYTLASWVLTADVRRVAILYLVALPLVGAAGFLSALLIRAGSLALGHAFLEADELELLSAWHGTGMVLLVLMPAIPAGLGYAVLGQSVAPRVALASWYVWAAGCIAWLASLVRAAPASTAPAWLAWLALGLIYLSLLAALRRRPQLTPFAWSIAFAAVAWFVRMATGGAEPALLAPLAVVPALGVVAEVIRDCSGGALYGEKLVPWLLGASAAATFLPWGSRLLATDFSPAALGLLPFAILPPATLVAALLATALRQPPVRTPALRFAWTSVGLAIVAGGAFLLLTMVPTNTHVAATVFEAAHLHYLSGAVLAALLAGLHHWRGALVGPAGTQAAAGSAAPLLFGAWNLTFFPDFVAGYMGRPWAPGPYPDSFEALQLISLFGTAILAVALIFAVGDLLRLRGEEVVEAQRRQVASRMSE